MATPRKIDQIGSLRERLRILSPISTPTAHRGERIVFATWVNIRGGVLAVRGSEVTEADRVTALNTRQFIVRSQSVSGVNEKMILEDRSAEGEYYDIERIDDAPEQPNRAYKIITATRRNTNVSAVELIPGIAMDYSQKFSNVTAAYVTITNGTLPDPTAKTADEINLLLQVYRGGLRLIYGDSGDAGFSITTATNRITPVLSFAGESVLVTQFAEL